MIRRPPRSTRTDTLFPYTTLFRSHGAGTVDVVADFSFITNRSLENPGAAELARQLLQPGWKRGTVHLVYAANMPSLWRLLLEHAWMAWLPALLALAAWLWMRTQRFGPWLPSPEPARRALLEHVQRSEEHTSELPSLMRISYAVFCLKKK